jgi:hypothetical protein
MTTVDASWVRVLPAGDVVFTNFEFDIQDFATKFGAACKGHKLKTAFHLDIDTPTWPTGIVAYWSTLRTKERIEEGEMAHFEVVLTLKQLKSLMLGAIEQHKLAYFMFNSYLGGGENGKSMYLSNNSCYSTKCCDQHEFQRVKQKEGDTMGIFFDMRQKDKGFMFLTFRGIVVGQMHNNLRAPIYPAISLVSANKNEAEEFVITNKREMPVGWNDSRFRENENFRLTAKDLKKRKK